MPYPAVWFLNVKIQKFQWSNCWVLECKGGQGDMPHASQFSQVFTWKKLWKIARTMSHARMLAFSFGECRDSNR